MKQCIRIIGGLYRGKKIHFPVVENLRPTPERVRETLFNWLMHTIRGATCLDAFAGSGALGLEAFSRGAANVVFTESSLTACQALAKTAASFNNIALQVIHTAALNHLQNTSHQYDIIFLDPPFAANDLEPCLEYLSAAHCLNKGGLIYTETAKQLKFNDQCWWLLKSKQAGQVYYALLEKI